MTGEVHLQKGRAKPIWAGHPWVLSGAVARVSGEPAAGAVVLVRDHLGKPIGRGFFAPGARIRVRMLTRDPEIEIDRAFLLERVRRAAAARAVLGLPGVGTTAFRAIHSEGDGLPGVVADRYGNHAVLQLTIRGMEDRRVEIAEALREAFGVRGVLLRRVPAFEEEEGLAGAEGDLLGEAVPPEIEIRERGVGYLVDPAGGQKTGHYCDHRENRALVRGMAAGRRVLDAFSGTGGFAVSAALGGAAAVMAADSSPRALDRVADNAALNGVSDRVETVKGDVFKLLRRLEREGERFGMVVLDPPRMAGSRRELKRALRGYKELNLRALRLLEDGGVLATASCTGLVSEEDFGRMLRDAAFDAKRELTVWHRRGQGADHPWSVAAPEGRYLKFVVGRA